MFLEASYFKASCFLLPGRPFASFGPSFTTQRWAVAGVRGRCHGASLFCSVRTSKAKTHAEFKKINTFFVIKLQLCIQKLQLLVINK